MIDHGWIGKPQSNRDNRQLWKCVGERIKCVVAFCYIELHLLHEAIYADLTKSSRSCHKSPREGVNVKQRNRPCINCRGYWKITPRNIEEEGVRKTNDAHWVFLFLMHCSWSCVSISELTCQLLLNTMWRGKECAQIDADVNILRVAVALAVRTHDKSL